MMEKTREWFVKWYDDYDMIVEAECEVPNLKELMFEAFLAGIETANNPDFYVGT